MIKFNKLLLINWMYYRIEEIEFGSSNLITGNTGSGKSAMIDAMQIIFLGEAGGSFFNKSAAGKHTDRTINTYLRGQYGINNFLRDGNIFSSYIVGEFYDTVENKYFCYGIMFDMIKSETRPNQDFFRIDARLDKSWFLKNKSAKNRKDTKDYLKSEGFDFKVFSTNSDYKQDFSYRVGVYDQQFFKLFKNAVAYEPLDKIEDFIVNNICNTAREIDTDSMETAIREYQRMRVDLKNFVAKRSALGEIYNVYESYLAKQKLRREQQYYIDRSEVDTVSELIAVLAQEEDILREEHTQKIQADNELDDELKQLKERNEELTKEIEGNPERIRKQELNRQYKELTDKISLIEKDGEYARLDLQQRTAAWRKHLSELTPLKLVFDKEQLTDFTNDIAVYSSDNFSALDTERFKRCSQGFNNLKIAVTQFSGQHKQRLEENRELLNECRTEINQLEKGRKQYDKKLLMFKDFLSKALSDKFGTNVTVDILADLIDITDKRWTNVIEGYMSRQKFYLLVDPQYYGQALKICRNYYNTHPEEEYKLIDGEKVYDEKKNIHPKALSHVLKSDNKYAEAYVEYLLGRVVRVDRLDDIRNYRTAVTDDGMLYSGYTFGRILPVKWKRHYIGKDSVQQQLAEAKERLSEYERTGNELSKVQAVIDSVVKEREFSEEFVRRIEGFVEDLKTLPTLNKESDKLFDEITSIDDTYVEKLKKEKKETETEIGRLEKKSKEFAGDIKVLETKLEDTINSIYDAEEELEEKSGKFHTVYDDKVKPEDEVYIHYKDILSQKKSAKSVFETYSDAIKRTGSDINKRIENFSNLVNAFSSEYRDSSISNDIHNKEWLNDYEKITSISVGDYEDKVEKARVKAEELFRNEFINKLKSNIDDATMEIKSLNRTLSEYRFGKTRYRFKCEPTENPELRQYYDMIMDSSLDGYNLYTMDFYARYETQIKTLFELISSSPSQEVSQSEIQQNIDKYKSFQTYLKFDLVEVDENDKEIPLSRMMGSRSGGERQTPFYIAMLASFMKIYRMKNSEHNSLRLVIFDEAFDKIDSSRIEEFINMLKTTGFQFIVSAPNEKAPYIVPLVETTWAISKPKENVSQAYLFRQKEMNNG